MHVYTEDRTGYWEAFNVAFPALFLHGCQSMDASAFGNSTISDEDAIIRKNAKEKWHQENVMSLSWL